MVYTVSVTSQGQISIPVKFRKELGLTKNSKANVSLEGKKVIVETVPDYTQLRGSLRTNKKPLSNRELHEFVARTVAKEFAKKMKRMGLEK
ncbi:MAG: hypothetical protein ACD_19C00317G0004 [uncultured bacterium]|uniref:SpoVT-AbrB domain-containing protein n=1 Tax=Candidatus Woesebacteria bacterium RIFCSPLOWO2_01_FULL_39_21 TaxID=1802519 RepID=A0A1F8BPL0_9BACT|nr:MAG: hypothetical protein ACD_19C00317G0004 [uncultured bacterium]OGM22387.1 MAG: hypothetical protein A2691_02090 [Candidatus Woesebacteria bacterium RIFCSPHIGHO2_01_FULL_39_23]OGM65218.1 MAG: hypothetical protein A2961_00795 [Candidatus Woesebacteria bacterium RIFCSPLOWO2_01_FULL_39_21]